MSLWPDLILEFTTLPFYLHIQWAVKNEDFLPECAAWDYFQHC